MKRIGGAILAFACACGREDIQLGNADDAAVREAESIDVTAPGAGNASDGCASSVCRENGAACSIAADCCSMRCEKRVCLEPGSCSAPGELCALRSACCSGR